MSKTEHQTEQAEQIEIKVNTEFLEDQSDINEQRFVFAYTIQIINHCNAPMQLMSRHWIITDGNEKVQEVQGDGVVGEQPVIVPNESFTYTSGVALDTEFGTMEGSYEMKDPDGNALNVTIPLFVLLPPSALH